jgi:pimeloyl-ACP methyl ester carboxylesterase
MLHHESVGSGPPVLLIPGMLGTAQSEWGRFLKPIADMGYTAIGVDLPGHGSSDMTKSLTMRVIVEEIDRLMTGLHLDPAVLVGYSIGGYAALSYALKHSNRVVGVWMQNTKFYWSGEEAENLAAELDLAYLTENKPEQFEQLKAMHTEEKLEAILPWLNKMISGMPDTGLTEFDLEDSEIPVMVSVGDRDEQIPVAEAIDLYHALRKSQLCVFPDTTHAMEALRDHIFLPAFRDFLNRLD